MRSRCIHIRALLVLIFCMAAGHFFAQTPFFRHYAVKDGLANSTVYECRQDSKGYMWFSTATGVSRFDGITFQNYAPENGLAGNEVFGIREDHSGRIWFITYTGKVSWFEEGKIYAAADDSLLKHLDFEYFLREIFEDAEGNIWFAAINEGVKCLTREGKVLAFESDNRKFRNIERMEMDGNAVVGLSRERKVYFEGQTYTREEPWQCKPLLLAGARELEKSELVFQCEDGLYVKGIKEMPGTFLPTDLSELEVNCMLRDRFANLWVGTGSNGVLLFREPLENGIVHRYLPGESISYIFKDREGNIWIATLGDGVFFLPVNSYETITQEDGLSQNLISALTPDRKGDHLLIGTQGGSIDRMRLKDRSIEPVLKSRGGEGLRKIRGMLPAGADEIWAVTDDDVSRLSRSGKIMEVMLKQEAGKCISFASGGRILVGTNRGCYIGTPGPQPEFNRIWGKRTLAVHEDDQKNIWIGTLNGVWRFDGLSVQPFLPELPELRIRISAIKTTRKGLIVIGSYGFGLIIANAQSILGRISVQDGLTANVIQSIFVDEEDGLWVSTHKGLNKLTLSSNGSLQSLRTYTEVDGLRSNEVQAAFVTGDTAFVATSNGLTVFNHRQSVSTSQRPVVHLTGLKVNQRDTILKENLSLNADQRNIRINFTGISFESGGDMRFKYKLSGVDQDWIETRNLSVSYPALDHGTYLFEVHAIAKNGFQSIQAANLSFRIRPRFSETHGFKALMVVMLLGLGGAAIGWRLKLVQRKTENEKRVFELEQRSLLSQMNPHFIFNAMSSIQQFINTNDKRSANRFLAKFAELMRKVLDNSRRSFVTVKDEFEALRLYLDLESLRFEHKFEYEIRIDPGIDQALVRIPSMLVQPYAENAILHGLSGMDANEKKGKLSISLEEKGNWLKCTILDNGIGRVKAAEIRSRRIVKHESTAMRNIQERLRILLPEAKDPVQVTDLYDDNNAPFGTQVVILIPAEFIQNSITA